MATIRSSTTQHLHHPTPLMFAAATLILPHGHAPRMGPVVWESHQDDIDLFSLACWEANDVPVVLQRYRCEDKDRYTLRIAAQQVKGMKPSALVHDVLAQWGVRQDQIEWWNNGLDLAVPLPSIDTYHVPAPALASVSLS